MTELATRGPSTDLAIGTDQTTFTTAQRAALSHIGVDRASDVDLEVFFHVVKRTGLDPFARQIYMIGRQTSEMGADGQWHKVTKQTIQTGIDGYRLIGRRAADKAKHTLSVLAPEWAHPDGTWRPVWSKDWGTPVAARVIVTRNGEEFPGVALFDEYAGRKSNGGLTQMWENRPAGMIAKCAEALAWRMAYPQDLSGVYTDEEMEQADNTVVRGEVVEPKQSGADRMRSMLGQEPAAAEASVAAPDESAVADDFAYPISDRTRGELFALFGQKGIADEQQLPGINSICGTTYESRSQLTEADGRAVIAVLRTKPDVATAEKPKTSRRKAKAEPEPDVVDAEIVEEGVPWADVLDTADDLGMSPLQVIRAFEEQYAVAVGDGTPSQYAEFLQMLRRDGIPA